MNFTDIFSSFLILFAVVDPIGNVPIILTIRHKGSNVPPLKTTLVATTIMVTFLFTGERLLGLFDVDVNSFAIAGSLILFILALEMVLGIELFRLENTSTAIFPVAFPLLAGAGSITALLSLRSTYNELDILMGLLGVMLLAFLALKFTRTVPRLVGETGVLVLKKIFGVILLAVSIKLFIANTGIVLPSSALPH